MATDTLIQSFWSQETNPAGEHGGWWGSKSVKPQCCPLQLAVTSSTVLLWGGGVSWGNLATSFVVLCSQQWWPEDLHGIAPASLPGPGISHRGSPYPSVSVVSLLGFAGNMLCNPTQKVRGGKLRKAKRKQPGFVALFLCLECWFTVSCGHMSVLCPCPGHWAQSQLVLPLLQECSLNVFADGSDSHSLIPPFFRLSPAVSSWLQSCVHGFSELFSLHTSPFCSHLTAFRCFNVWISPTCLCIEQESFVEL